MPEPNFIQQLIACLHKQWIGCGRVLVLPVLTLVFTLTLFSVSAQDTKHPPSLESDNYRLYTNFLDSVKNLMENQIDSLEQLGNLPQDILENSVDSLNRSIEKIESHLNGYVQKVNSSVANLEAKVRDSLPLEKYNDINNKVQAVDQKLDSISQSRFLKDLGFDLNETDLQKLGIDPPNLSLGLDKVKALDLDLDINANIDFVKGSKINLPDQEILDKMKGYASKATKQVELFNAESIKSYLEGQVELGFLNFKEIKELKKQEKIIAELQAEMSQYTQKLEMATNPEQLKTQGVNLVKSTAKEHFEGKMEVVQQAQAQMAKYKKHYDNVQSVKDLPKRPPNRMKGKPLNQRLLPGLSFQSYSGEFAEFDISPQVEFRWTGKLNVGIGGYYRVAFDKQDISLQKIPERYGFRTFTSVAGYKKFYLYGSIDGFNGLKLMPDMSWGERQWQYDYLLGVGRSYKINKKLNGFTIASLNLSNLSSDFDFEKYQVRFGFRLKL
ncbi:MAG: hypothetical protein OEW75_04145 [Cyclobacteriaceae bacterium]|nr:hypothetical protein [Cyclobacteriaceae bacterium]